MIKIGKTYNVSHQINFGSNQLRAISNESPTTKSSSAKPPKCSKETLSKIESQLVPNRCRKAGDMLCSFSMATRCPQSTWLDDYYHEIQKDRVLASKAGYFWSPSIDPPYQHFLGISIGCNKGFDAINTLRMGIHDDDINKSNWKGQMSHNGRLHGSICKQDRDTDLFDILPEFQSKSREPPAPSLKRPSGEMHCIEPVPSSFQLLNYSAQRLNYIDKGLVVTHAAISNVSGTALFQAGNEYGGIENNGIDTCERLDPSERANRCQAVPVMSLSDYMNKYVDSKPALLKPINILSIDTEGFDYEVLFGATNDILRRVEYLEFEYHSVGVWKDHNLSDAVEMLDTNGFTCYWAGMDRLWRITDCWISHYDAHVWSNVACVNRSVMKLASKMEEIFERTLMEDIEWRANHPVIRDLMKNSYM